jgi:thiol-disulfide isomerase/thioredoxin
MRLSSVAPTGRTKMEVIFLATRNWQPGTAKLNLHSTLLRTLLALLALSSALLSTQTPSAAELNLRDLAGQPRTLAEYRGKIVVLNFWATWCVPCVTEMPMLERIHREYAQHGVVVIAPSADEPETQPRVPGFIKKHKLTFPVWIGATTAHMQKFGLGVALPATAFIDRNGSIIGRVIGPLDDKDVRNRLDWMLGRPGAKEPEPLLNSLEAELKKHEEETGHQHGSIALEGASSVPS